MQVMTSLNLVLCSAAAATLALSSSAALAQDGAPHIAIAQEESGELVLEFEVSAGLDESSTPPKLTLDTSAYDPTFPGYRTFPINNTPSPNDDLGFVSEVEGAGEEGGTINGDIVVRLLNKDSNFLTFLGGQQLFTTADPDLELGSSFDLHPVWVLANTEGDFSPASASFEVFDIATGGIGQGATSLGQFDIVLAVPEPTTATLAVGLAGLAVIRRRAAPRLS